MTGPAYSAEVMAVSPARRAVARVKMQAVPTVYVGSAKRDPT